MRRDEGEEGHFHHLMRLSGGFNSTEPRCHARKRHRDHQRVKRQMAKMRGAAQEGRFGDGRGWHESALWWDDRSALVVAEAVGTPPYFRSRPGQVIGPHPMMRISPPHVLRGFPAQHVLMGHGHPVHAPGAGALVDDALAHARGTTPRWLLSLATGSVRRADARSPIVTR